MAGKPTKRKQRYADSDKKVAAYIAAYRSLRSQEE